MALSVKVGSFTRPTSASTDTVITGLGFAPTCVIFINSHALTAGTWRAGAQANLGVIAKRTLQSGSVILGGTSAPMAGNDANATPNMAIRHQGGLFAAGLLTVASPHIPENVPAAMTFDGDGFTIDWDPGGGSTAYDGEAELEGYLALGGDADAMVAASPNPAINTLSVGQAFVCPLNVAFQPVGAIAFAEAAGERESASYGVVGSGLQQWAVAQSAEDPADPSNVKRRLTTGACVSVVDPTDGAVKFAAKLTRLSPSGLTFEVVTATTDSITLGVVAIGGCHMDAGTFAKDTGGAPDPQTVAVVGKAKAAFFATVAHTADNATTDHMRGSFGVSDGTNHRAVAWTWDDNAATSNGDTLFSTTAALVKADNGTPAVDAASAVTSFAAQQINLSWSPNDAIATRFAYLTFGETTPLTSAATVSVGPTQEFARLGVAHQLTGHAALGTAHHAQPAWLGSVASGFTEGGTWTPSDLGAARLVEVRGKDLALADGAQILDWDDQSANDWDATGSGGSARPTFALTDEAADFERASSQFLDILELSASQLDRTIALVVDLEDTAVNQALVGTSANGGLVLRVNTSNQLQWTVPTIGDIGNTTGTVSGTGYHVLRGTVDATTWKLAIDGTEASGAHAVTLTGGLTATLGKGFSGEFLDGRVKHVVVATELSAADELRLDGFLAHTYGLTGNLPASHPYKTNAPSKGVGAHMLAGAGALSVGGPTVPLRLDHTGKLTGAASVTVVSGHVWPAQTHALTGAATIETGGGTVLLGQVGTALSGSAIIHVDGAGHLRQGHALVANARIVVGTASLGLGGADLPLPKTLGPNDLVGTVNLFRNPDFEAAALDGNDSDPLGGATISLTSAQAWHGTQAMQVSLANAANSGVTLRSLRGLPYAGKPLGFLAQFRVRAASTIASDSEAFARIVYTDAATTTGDAVIWNPTPDNAWLTISVPVVVANPLKTVSHVELDIRRVAALAGQAFYLDGVQIELDRGHGHTPWAVGTFGEPYHRWWGGAHASITVRDAIPGDFRAPGVAGQYRIDAFMHRANADNVFLEDLSRFVVNAAVTADASRDVSWTLECELLPEGWAKLTPFEDWLAPFMRVTLPDGSVREGQLGHFVVLPSAQEVDEWGRRVQVDARSGEVLLQMQGTKGIALVKENTKLMHAARVILDAAHLGERNNGHRSFDLPDDGERAHRDMTWERKEAVLTIVNDLLRKAGKTPLYATKTGVLKTVNRKKRRLKHLDPVRVWGANLPANVSLDPWVKRVDATTGEVVGTVRTTPDLGRFDDNKIVVVSVAPRKPRIRVVRYITDPDNPVNPKKRKRIKERRIEMDVGSQADAEALAEAIAEEIGTKLETVELAVLPDPETEFLRNVVYLAVYDAAREPVAVGKFKVNSVTYGFTAEEALMQLNLGFVHSVEQLEAFDPTGWEEGGIWQAV